MKIGFTLGLNRKQGRFGDAIAPVLSSPTDAANGSAAMTGTVTTDEVGNTLYWFVATSSTPPTKPNLKAGVGAVAWGNQAVTITGVQDISTADLEPETTYYTFYLQTDNSGNDSNIAAADGFTTGAASSDAGYPTGLLLVITKAA